MAWQSSGTSEGALTQTSLEGPRKSRGGSPARSQEGTTAWDECALHCRASPRHKPCWSAEATSASPAVMSTRAGMPAIAPVPANRCSGGGCQRVLPMLSSCAVGSGPRQSGFPAQSRIPGCSLVALSRTSRLARSTSPSCSRRRSSCSSRAASCLIALRRLDSHHPPKTMRGPSAPIRSASSDSKTRARTTANATGATKGSSGSGAFSGGAGGAGGRPGNTATVEHGATPGEPLRC